MSYEIVRFKFKGENEVVGTFETLEEAQDHCNRPDTRGEGWFDGYRKVEDEDGDNDSDE